MQLQNDVKAIETKLAKHFRTPHDLCAAVPMDRATWWRWANGKVKNPRKKYWLKVQKLMQDPGSIQEVEQ